MSDNKNLSQRMRDLVPEIHTVSFNTLKAKLHGMKVTLRNMATEVEKLESRASRDPSRGIW